MTIFSIVGLYVHQERGRERAKTVDLQLLLLLLVVIDHPSLPPFSKPPCPSPLAGDTAGRKVHGRKTAKDVTVDVR